MENSLRIAVRLAQFESKTHMYDFLSFLDINVMLMPIMVVFFT